MSASIWLPGRDEPLVIAEPGWASGYPPPVTRRVFAAAHVAASPGPEAAGAGGLQAGAVIDWDSTLAFREHLWAHGFGIAEAMDTSQRGMGLSWEQARELIGRSAERAAARRRAGAFPAWPAEPGPTSWPRARPGPLARSPPPTPASWRSSSRPEPR